MQESSAIHKVAFLGEYLPRKCSIATFTTDLRRAVTAEFPGLQCLVLPVNDLAGGYNYPAEVRFEIAAEDSPSYLRAADSLNHNDSSIYSDRSAFKSAMTGVAEFSRSRFERLDASPATQQSQVGVGLHIAGPDQADNYGENHRHSRNVISLGLISNRAGTEQRPGCPDADG